MKRPHWPPASIADAVKVVSLIGGGVVGIYFGGALLASVITGVAAAAGALSTEVMMLGQIIGLTGGTAIGVAAGSTIWSKLAQRQTNALSSALAAMRSVVTAK